MKLTALMAGVLLAATTANAQDGVLIKCGASAGHGYFFHDEVMNPKGPEWSEDGMSNGQIILVKLGEEWDILFDDAIGGHSYRKDGARVIPLGGDERFLMVGAFYPSSYADVYTFDLEAREVAWSSNKPGGLMPKVSVMRASCDPAGR